jgi:tyrosinase
LVYWENVMKDQNDRAVLPWWDWTSDTSHIVGVPASFTAAKVNGNANSLYSGPVPAMLSDPPRQTTRFPGDPSQLPTANDVENLLSLTSFVDFTAQIEDIHDFLHGWTGGMDPNNQNQGGDMGVVATAAYDPIFWSHHCMIDRLWYLWQLRQGVNNIPQDYMTMPLAPFNQQVGDVLDINRLGYEYVASQQVLTTTAPT